MMTTLLTIYLLIGALFVFVVMLWVYPGRKDEWGASDNRKLLVCAFAWPYAIYLIFFTDRWDD